MELIYAPHEAYAREYIRNDIHCDCGGRWQVVAEKFKIVNIHAVKEYLVECSQCKDTKVLEFDTSSFNCKC